MSHPYPVRSSEPVVMLTPTSAPSEPHQPARQPTAEVLLSDQAWMQVTVLAWHRLREPTVQALTGHRVTWLVRLRLADGSDNWYEYVERSFR